MVRGAALLSWLSLGVMILAVAGCGGGKAAKSGGESFASAVAKIKKAPDASVRATRLTKLALRQHKLGAEQQAEQALGMAADECKEIDDVMMRAEAWSSVAIAQATMNNKAGARIAMSSAREAAEEIKDKEIKAQILIKLAKAQAEMDNADGVSETLQSVEKLAAELKDAEGKPDLTSRVVVLDQAALAYQKAGDESEVERLLAANLELAKSIEDPKGQADALADIAVTQHELGNKEASKTLDAAFEAAKKIGAAYSKSLALAEIGAKYSKLGNNTKAHDVLKEAELTTTKIPDADIQTETLQKIREMSGRLPKAK